MQIIKTLLFISCMVFPALLNAQLTRTVKGIDYIKGDVNFKFNFISPTNDYQENGLFDVGGDSGFFSGVYKVVTVKNSFRKGKFTQTLTNVRNRIQP